MFSIDNDLCITYHPEPIADREDLRTFSTLREFSRLLEVWSRPQLAALWNSFAGTVPFSDLKPVKAFTHSPADAIRRIWEAIQRFVPGHREAAGEPEAPETPVEDRKPASRKTRKTSRKAVSSPRKVSKGANRGKRASEPAAARQGSKKELVISMISRKSGASMDELMEQTGWQRHTLRGFISTLGSKHGFTTTSEITDKRGLVYHAA